MYPRSDVTRSQGIL